MLVLTRKAQEEIRIGNDVKVVVLEVKGSQVRLGIKAPRDVQVTRPDMTVKKTESELKNL